jgi:hypothetical protein
MMSPLQEAAYLDSLRVSMRSSLVLGVYEGKACEVLWNVPTITS